MAEIRDVQNRVVKYAFQRGWLYRRMQYIGRNGCPDVWFFKGGRVIIVEFKDLGEKPRLQQQREIDRLRVAGMEVHVIDNTDDGYALFD